jgi:integrase
MEAKLLPICTPERGITMKLNSKTIATLELPGGKSDVEYWDEEIPGFGLRIRAGGSRKFIYRYRIGSTYRRMLLGPATSGTAPEARKTAERLAHKVGLGEDPAMAKATARAEAQHTVGSLIEKFLNVRKPDMKPRYYVEVERHLSKDAKCLHRFPVKVVAQSDIATLLNEVATDKRGPTANRVRASLSMFFSWVLREGTRLPEGNPVTHTNKRPEVSRDRVLTAAELKRIWGVCGDDDYGSIIKLLMLTGQRRDEIGGLRREEIKGEQIELPKGRTKNRREHIVPLSDPAKAILDRFFRGEREYLFGRDGTGFSGWSKSKDRLDGKLRESGKFADWHLHDLRRTISTAMHEELGIAPHIVEAVLNHISGHKAGVAGVYNRAKYPKEKREALNLWAEHLMAIVEGRDAKVVPLKRGA